jgi:hypothetical protein
MQAVLGVSYIGDDLGADLQKRFGGELFGDDESE